MSAVAEHQCAFGLASNVETFPGSVSQKMSTVNEPLLSRETYMSKDRRRFLVVIVFDACLIVLLWVISTVSKGSDWPTVFFREVNILQRDFMKISVFDVVMVAVIRTCILLVFYAVLLVSHWLPVAVTTITTTLFLVAKALLFFSPTQGNLPQYMLFLSSFVVAWFELWMVPFHILPRERRDMIVPEISAPSLVSVRNQQTDEEFRSAMEYSSDSEEENLPAILFAGKVYSKAEYIKAVELAELKAKESLAEISSWKLLHRSNPEIRMSQKKHVYYIRDEIACSPKFLFKAFWKDNKLWNKQITEFRVVLHIDSATELVYIVTAPALRGYISPRDFLDVRKMKLDTEKDVYEGAYVSVDSSIVPANVDRKLIRGINGPNYVRVTRSLNDSKMVQFEWIQESDFKGNVPKRLIESTMCSFFHGYMVNLKTFVSINPAE